MVLVLVLKTRLVKELKNGSGSQLNQLIWFVKNHGISWGGGGLVFKLENMWFTAEAFVGRF